MALYRITVKRPFYGQGIVVEPGMSVEVSSFFPINPICTNGGKSVRDAFLRVYGIDIAKAGILNVAYLDAVKIG